MRIAVNGRFYSARATGVQRVAAELVGRLCRRADVALYVPARCAVPESVARRAASVTRGALRGVAWEQLELPWRTRGGGAAGADETDDVVRLDPANVGPIRGRRRVLVLHDVLPLTHPDAYRPAFRHWFRWVVAPSARQAEAVAMFSRWARSEAVRVLGLDPDRVHVLPQGVEPFHEPASPEAVRRTLRRLDIHGPFILAAGAGDPRKNERFLVDVLARIRAAGGAAPTLVVVGRGYGHVHARRSGVPASAAGRDGAIDGIGGLDIRHPGFVSDDELRALYTGARLFCFPSHAEGFGRPPLEAMACGTPVVVSGYGAAREVLGQAATVLPLRPDAWAHALSDLLAEPAEARARRQTAGRDHAAGFRWDAAVDGLLELCRNADARSAPGTAATAPAGPSRLGL